MKKYRKITLCLCLVFIFSCPLLWAKEKSSVAVIPFTVSSSENIEYIRQGIVNMISSRLSVGERIDVISRDQVTAALADTSGKELAPAELVGIGKKLKADFIVWGSITKIGSSLSIDGKLFDVAANKGALAIVAQCETMDEVIPRINDFTQRIDTHINGPAQQAAASVPSSREIIVSRTPQASAQTARESEIISGMKSGKKGTLTSMINPDFINEEQPLNRETFWKSTQYSYEIRGMDIGDVNGDGRNETVTIDTNNVYIYQRSGQNLTLLQQIKGKSSDNYIALDVADINGNGVKEIIVTNFLNDVDSFIIEYKNGQFVTIASGLHWFLRVVDTGDALPLLLGQRLGYDKIFENPIYEIIWKNGGYEEGRRAKIPQGLSVYGLTLARITPGGAERVIALDDDDYLRIFEHTDKPLNQVITLGGTEESVWKSEDVYGGSKTYVEVKYIGKPEDDPFQHRAYINVRILTYDTNKDGKREIIIVKNGGSSASRLFQDIRIFNAAEVFNLEWENLGMVENWRTKKINGYVSDYQFKDIDNDGENEVVLSLVVSVGGTLRQRSVIVAYELKGN